MHSALASLLQTTQYILNVTNIIIVLNSIIIPICFHDQTGLAKSGTRSVLGLSASTHLWNNKERIGDSPPVPMSVTLTQHSPGLRKVKTLAVRKGDWGEELMLEDMGVL